MSQGDRLTRRELSWLLTQEARSAAHTLRKGVAAMSQSPAAAEAEPAEFPENMESSLNALDDAMRMIASLQSGAGKRSSRGRIEVASIVCEVAPDAKVHIAPGSGTEVHGDEAELRRMMQVLLAQAAGVRGLTEGEAPEVWIERDGDDVRVSVALGPEFTGGASAERAWLNRVALRYGGRLELVGGQESLVLPAEGASERNEIAALRQELEAAQQQGEAYARELAAVYAAADAAERAPVGPSTVPPPSDSLAPIIGLTSGVAAQLREVLAGIPEPAPSRGAEQSPHAESLARAANQLSELVSDLSRFSKVRVDELPASVDLVQLVHTITQEADARATRHAVTFELELPERLDALVPKSATSVLLRVLLNHAIAATPRGETVTVSVARAPSDQSVVLEVSDAGASVPSGARDALLWRRIDPATLGRPKGIQLLAASAIVANVHGVLELDDASRGGTLTRVILPVL